MRKEKEVANRHLIHAEGYLSQQSSRSARLAQRFICQHRANLIIGEKRVTVSPLRFTNRGAGHPSKVFGALIAVPFTQWRTRPLAHDSEPVA